MGAKDLNGAMLYTKQDQERTPHFIYRTADGEEIGILYEKAEYLEPKPRALTKEEIENLIQVLSRNIKQELEKHIGKQVYGYGMTKIMNTIIMLLRGFLNTRS